MSQHQDEFLIDYQRLYTDLLREKDLLQEVNVRSQNWLDQKEQRIQELTAQVMGLHEKVKQKGGEGRRPSANSMSKSSSTNICSSSVTI